MRGRQGQDTMRRWNEGSEGGPGQWAGQEGGGPGQGRKQSRVFLTVGQVHGLGPRHPAGQDLPHGRRYSGSSKTWVLPDVATCGGTGHMMPRPVRL